MSSQQAKTLQVFVIGVHITISNFIFGYTIGVLNTCQDNVAHTMSWSESEKSFYVNIFSTFIPLGALIGSSITATLCSKFGRLRTVQIMDGIVLTGSVLSSVPQTTVFGLGRFVCGFAVGISLAIAPTYIGEMIPQKEIRRVGPMMSIMISLGLTLSYSLSLVLPLKDFSDDLNYFWVFMFALPGVFAIYQFMYFQFILKLDTPVYYLKKNDYEKFNESLRKIYWISDNSNSDEGRFEYRRGNTFTENISYKQLICNRKYSKMLRIGVIIATLQQLSGENAVIFYSFNIFKLIGLSLSDSRIFTVFIGVTTIVSSCSLIIILKYVGRKVNMFIGFLATGIDLVIFGLIVQFASEQGYLLAALLLVYIILFTISLQGTMWLYISEIQIERAITISTFFNYLANVFVNLVFPTAVEKTGIAYTFYFFALWMFLATWYVFYDAIETRNISKVSIEKKLFVQESSIRITEEQPNEGLNIEELNSEELDNEVENNEEIAN